MNLLVNKNNTGIRPAKPSLTRLAIAIALAGFSITVQAGKIVSSPTTDLGVIQDGFGGWNLDNVEVILDGMFSTFDEITGSYSFDPVDSNYSYFTEIDDGAGTVMGQALAKPWPVGEPAGIKIVNDDFDVKNDKPTNCIMSTSYLDGHFLDEEEPRQVLCSGPFQSHKRYKIAMLNTTVPAGSGSEKSIDMVFNVEAEVGSRDYQVFQKINNWTDVRLTGFTIQVGTGVGAAFVPAASTDPVVGIGVGVANLSLSVPDIWSRSQLANFSTGLFGPIDLKRDRPPGFFDPDTRAGFEIVEYPNVSGETDTLTSGIPLSSDYADVPPGTAAVSAAANQFGNWLPNTMLPYGIFFDDDGNPDTDAELKAWYGYNPDLLTFSWMTGVADGFVKVEDLAITTWSGNNLYSMGVIDDLVNVGLNYVVTVGDTTNFSAFTIRVTPIAEAVATPAPSYVGELPTPVLVFTSDDANVTLTPFPEFIPGNLLTARVGDADRNSVDPLLIDIVDVTVEATGATVIAAEPLTLTELGENRGVFAANLPDKFSDVAAGTVVSVTYTDTVTNLTAPGDITVSTTAVGSLPAGVLAFDPASYTVAENDGSLSVVVKRTDGSDGIVTVEYQTVSGTAIGGGDYIADTGTLIFENAVVSQTIPLVLVNDTVAEAEESFTVLLSNAQGGGVILGDADMATIVITDADVDVPVNPVDDTSDSSGDSDGIFSFGWLTTGLVLIGLLGRIRRRSS